MLHRIWTITGSPLRVLSAAEKRTGSYHLQGTVMLSGVEASLRTQLRQMGFLARSGFRVSAIDGLDYANFQKAPLLPRATPLRTPLPQVPEESRFLRLVRTH